MRSLAILLAATLLACAGCARPGDASLPTYPRMDESAALRILAERSRAVRSMSGEGSLHLREPDGRSVRFDAAVAMQPPDRVRMRAWKFSQAVFDLTLTPDGLWLVAPRDDGRAEQIRSAGVGAGEFARVWSLLSGGFFDDPDLFTDIENRRDVMIVTRQRPDEPAVVCEVDRATLTPRRYILIDDQNNPRFTLILSEYHLSSDIAWPRRVEARGPSGTVVVELRGVELNSDLPGEAFTPPSRAERLP